MPDIITREGKGSPLTHQEMDGNLEKLNVAIEEQQARTTRRYVLTSSQTFVLPPGAKMVRVQCVGGGGGGASGSAVSGSGGAGATGGCYTDVTLTAAEFGSSVAVTIGQGGLGGVPAPGGGHVAGGSGTATIVAAAVNFIAAAGGAGALSSNGVAISTQVFATVSPANSGAGGTSSTVGGASIFSVLTGEAAGSGGGGGGGNGLRGGFSNSGGMNQVPSGEGGAGVPSGTGADAAQDAPKIWAQLTGSGGGGGGGGPDGGGAGGRGNGYGSGGGGGGGCGVGNVPGAGGDGQPGVVIITVDP